jgi:hypothetical protein
MNDCVHFDEEQNECGIFNEPCKEPIGKGCYLPVAKRDEMLDKCRGDR